ncbi:MAG TPA: hypothetical protein VGL94_23395 [Ktedonobacteraceae bacterium]|jgi:hypothetical protein
MSKTFNFFVRLICITALIAVFGLGVIHSNQAWAANCQSTGYMQDSINLTAAIVVTKSRTITHTTIDAQGCNIGVYFAPGSSGSISNSSEISGANYYGVLNNGGNVSITRSSVHDIGENPFNGTQHGVGISFISSDGKPVRGTISQN